MTFPQQDQMTASRTMRRKIFTRLTLVVVIGLLFLQARRLALRAEPQDFAAYWAAAQLAAENPYSHEKVLEVERSIGFKQPTPLLMRNPPWTLPLVLPSRWFGYPTAFALYTLASITVLAGSTLLLWRFYGGQISISLLLLLLLFTPTLALLRLGQFFSALPFAGICLFVVCIERRRDWIAGASLFLVLLKPHLFVPFLVCLGLWIVWTRRYRVLAGATVALSVASGLAITVNHHIFSKYAEAIADVRTTRELPPTLGINLQVASGSMALAMLPTIIALAWAVWCWWIWRHSWEWKVRLPVLLLASLISAYYMLLYDEVALLAALVPVALAGGRRFWFPFATVSAACLCYLMGWLDWMPGGIGRWLSFWSACGWWIVYLIASTRSAQREQSGCSTLKAA